MRNSVKTAQCTNNSTAVQNTINLEGNPDLDIFRFANAQAAKGFTTKLPKLETPCEFYRKNKFRRFNYKSLGNGLYRLSVLDQQGHTHSAVSRNFQLAYIKLQRQFYEHYELKNM